MSEARILTLDEAIEHAEAVAGVADEAPEGIGAACAAHHRQLAAWLREIKPPVLPCGHPAACVVSGEEGGCGWCAALEDVSSLHGQVLGAIAHTQTALAADKAENELDGGALRVVILREAAGLVCDYCAGRAFPRDPESHAVHGPNAAGNYVHRPIGPEKLCKATAIWSRIAWDERVRI